VLFVTHDVRERSVGPAGGAAVPRPGTVVNEWDVDHAQVDLHDEITASLREVIPACA